MYQYKVLVLELRLSRIMSKAQQHVEQGSRPGHPYFETLYDQATSLVRDYSSNLGISFDEVWEKYPSLNQLGLLAHPPHQGRKLIIKLIIALTSISSFGWIVAHLHWK